MANKKCFVLCLSNLHKPLLLENLKPVILGRSPHTKIKEKRCSKRQVELTANYENFTVNYKHLGSNDGKLKETHTKSGGLYELRHGDIFEFVLGQFPHKIVFEPEPPHSTSGTCNNSLKTSEKETTSETIPVFNIFKRQHEETKGESSNGDCKRRCMDTNKAEEWESFYNGDLLVFNRFASYSDKVAAYDMDGTLITTVSGRVFPKDINDWKIIYPEVPSKLKQLNQDGYKIVIFSNQAGIAKGKISPTEIQTKISRLIKKIGVPAQGLVSTGKGKYRKPITGMWDFFIKECNGGKEVDKEESFYVGDAAGRPEIPKQRKKDHSVSDRLFAINVALPFYTPEEHFLGHKRSDFKMPKFLPGDVSSCGDLYDPPTTIVPRHSLEVILLMGFPGCGKSTFVDTHLLKHGFVSVNRDKLGSWQKCVSVMETALKNGHHVVVDNTNPDRPSRDRYIEVAKKLKVPIRCFLFDVSLEHAKHNNKFRELIRSEHTKISDMIYNMYKSKLTEPSITEGFSEVVKVNFVSLFKNSQMETLYKLFLLEN